jgi:hypothetical protein
MNPSKRTPAVSILMEIKKKGGVWKSVIFPIAKTVDHTKYIAMTVRTPLMKSLRIEKKMWLWRTY